ncbi:hypothetical protein DFQ10_103251 [Winogradskyella eximia]|uniref:Uncharacterized protein n=1 Tax=Winogradskyella eximia TaxID=262006 RepID=A0A3D9H4Z2_9FLAO|nr:DUF6090 family protein [Winogradskyella eximia]RED44564.1 hypothetical protein DFQ10_103251 [Winogradskyella eximia]
MENKTSKYFKYAAGEIVLVVIGILIALQINNWNENRKINNQETVYLQDLKNDITFDIETLNARVANNNLMVHNIDTILTLISSKKKFTEQDETLLANMTLTLFGESYFIPEKGTINQIQSSSSGSFIKNKTLRDLIFRYYSNSERVEKNMEQSIQIYQHQIITPKLVHPAIAKRSMNINAEVSPLNMSLLIKDNAYLNALTLKSIGTQNQNIQYLKIIGKAEEILSIINTELSND